MSSALPALTVVAGLIQRHGALLICQRRRDAAFALQWEFPGGKLEAGEGSAAALRRELEEELGIVADVGAELYRTQHDYPGVYSVKLVLSPRYRLQRRLAQSRLRADSLGRPGAIAGVRLPGGGRRAHRSAEPGRDFRAACRRLSNDKRNVG